MRVIHRAQLPLNSRAIDPSAFKQKLSYWALPVTLIILWQVLSLVGLIKPLTLPSPSRIAVTFWQMLVSGELPLNIGVSLLRVLEGFSLAAFLGLSLGIAVCLSPNLYRWTDFIIQALKPIPPIAWIPLAILWFGIEESSKIYIIFIGAFFPILINTIEGVRNTDQKFVELAKVLEVSRWKFVGRMLIPGALPSIMTGLRVGLASAWMCVVAAELIAASSGVGYMIMDARQLSQTDVVLVGMITIGIIGKLMDDLLRHLEQKLVSWKVFYSGQ
jgi:sulfonate transport system permease protein